MECCLPSMAQPILLELSADRIILHKLGSVNTVLHVKDLQVVSSWLLGEGETFSSVV